MTNRRAIAEFVGTFVLGLRRRGIGGDRRRGNREPRRGVRVRALAAGDGLRDRPDLRLPHQPGRHRRAAGLQADENGRGDPLLDRPSSRRDRWRRSSCSSSSRRARAATTSPTRASARTGTATTRRSGFPLGAALLVGDRPDLLPRVHRARRDRPDRERGLRRHSDRPGADADPPRRHPGDQHCRSTRRGASAPRSSSATGPLTQLWLFIVAPLIGAVLASVVHSFLFTGAAPVEPEQSAVAAETPGDATSRAAARRARGRARP